MTFFVALLPYLEQSTLRNSIGTANPNFLPGQRVDDPTKVLGSTQLKVLQAPNDPSRYRQVDWQWPYTNPPELVVQETLTSYVPNARVFGKFTPGGTMSVWDVAWSNAGAGQTRMTDIKDGTSNTLAVVEKQMATGDTVLSFKDWGTIGDPNTTNGVNMWAVTDTQPDGLAFFGCTCKDPTQTWDAKDGQWWLGNCRLVAGSNAEYFQPPVPAPIPSQQNPFNIYPFNSGGVVLVLMCDASVHRVTTSISVVAWSAAVTPSGGEAVTLDF